MQRISNPPQPNKHPRLITSNLPLTHTRTAFHERISFAKPCAKYRDHEPRTQLVSDSLGGKQSIFLRRFAYELGPSSSTRWTSTLSRFSNRKSMREDLKRDLHRFERR